MEQNEVLKALQRNHAAELKLAAERLEGTARHTEIIPSKVLSEMTGHEILLKPENLQVTGSFKIRGAYNKIASLSDEQLARGIVTASAGNHAQGVAYAARERGAKATICMPQITPPLKVDATKAYGADVVLYGEVFDESAARAQELSDKEGMIYVPPFDDYEVLCGQGTIGLEILEDVPNVTGCGRAAGWWRPWRRRGACYQDVQAGSARDWCDPGRQPRVEEFAGRRACGCRRSGAYIRRRRCCEASGRSHVRAAQRIP